MTLVRPVREPDVAAVVDVQVETWQAAYTGIVPDGFLRAMSRAERVDRHLQRLREPDEREAYLLAEVDGEVVGFVRVAPCRDDDHDPGHTGEVWALYVRPAHWSSGVGRALMDAGLDALRRFGFTTVTLWVLEDNVRARRFYEVAGFATDGARQVLDLGGPVAEVRYTRAL